MGTVRTVENIDSEPGGIFLRPESESFRIRIVGGKEVKKFIAREKYMKKNDMKRG
jgi:hypothetical protein